jgi:drug/metabolite transporter (DMT)-like permease
MGRELVGIGLLLASATAYGTSGIFVRVAYEGGATPFAVLAIRFAVALVAMWAGVLLTRAAWRQPVRRQAVLVGLGLVYALGSLGIVVGFMRLTVGLAVLLFYTYPTFSVLLSRLLGEPLTRRKVVALGLSVAGLVLTIGWDTGGVDAVGVAAVLGGAVASAVFMVASERAMGGLSPLVATAYVLLGSAVLSVVGVALGGLGPTLTATAWAASVAIGLVCTVLALGLLLAGIARVGPVRAAIVSTFEPVVAVVLAAIFLGEGVGAAQLAGGALILLAVLLLAGAEAPAKG